MTGTFISVGESISLGNNCWTIYGTALASDKEFRLLGLWRDGLPVLELIKNSNRTISISFGIEGKKCIRLTTRLKEEKNNIRINCLGHKYQLIVNERLEDEDWPVIPIILDGAECFCNNMQASIRGEASEELMPYKIGETTNISKLTSDGIDCFFGDCMPLWHNGVYHLFYLYDRRRHGSKNGFAGHQWAHISTTDLINWKRHPFAVTIDCVEEATFRTGSVIYYNNKFYAFYVTLRTDGKPSPVTYSVSDDGDYFVKSGKNFYLDDRYDNVGLRDPQVFLDNDGRLNMFLVTKMNCSDGTRKGCVLRFVGDDVDNWVQDEEPFWIIDIDEYPECVDYFCWNGKYYFSYCVHSVAHYMVSDNPFSGFKYVPHQLIGGNGFVVPKSAPFYDRRIAAAFSWTPYFGYAGELVFLEMLQEENGCLRFEIPRELIT